MSEDLRYIIPPTYDDEGVQLTSGLLHNGMEVPDPTPTEPPPGSNQAPTLSDMIRKMIQGEISRQAAEVGFESFEEAEDFDVDDEGPEGITPYEEMFLRPPTASETPSTPDARSAQNPQGGPPAADPPQAPAATSQPEGPTGGPKSG